MDDYAPMRLKLGLASSRRRSADENGGSFQSPVFKNEEGP